MKKVRLVSLTLRNFKGARDFRADFGENDTRIHGRNGSGKTTVFDGFSWLLYGKDSHGRSDFNIKTLTPDNEPIHNLEHEVAGSFEVIQDDKTYTHDLRRIYKEKWVKKRGADEPKMDGHETLFYYNDVPMSASEFKTKVDAIINEEVSRLITNPLFFNVNMKWQDRRSILSKMAGEISDGDIIDMIATTKDDFQEVINILNSDKTLAESKRELSAKRKRLKEELETIPARIDEVTRSTPEALDWDGIESKKMQAQQRIGEIDEEISDKQKAQNNFFETITRARNDKFRKENELRDLIERLDRDHYSATDALRSANTKLESILSDRKRQREENLRQINSLSSSIETMTADSDRKREEFKEWNAKQWSIDPTKCECPTCNRPLENEEVERLTREGQQAFDNRKAEAMKSIQGYGKKLKADIECYEERIIGLKQEVGSLEETESDISEQLKTNREELDAAINGDARSESAEEMSLRDEIAAIEIPEQQSEDFTAQREEKSRLSSEVEAFNDSLSTRRQIEMSGERLQQLKDQERKVSQEIAEIERVEIAIDKFNRARVETIEARINGLFDPINVGTIDAPEWKNVQFKMFNQQINGGESETWECLVNGVPFSDINTAKKLNAGISIINALCRFYGITAPIFVDGRESVTHIITTPAQLISLVVDPSFDRLTLVA